MSAFSGGAAAATGAGVFAAAASPFGSGTTATSFGAVSTASVQAVTNGAFGGSGFGGSSAAPAPPDTAAFGAVFVYLRMLFAVACRTVGLFDAN